MNAIDSYANLFIVAAPSGGGKTSMVRHVAKTVPNIAISISHTTRPMNPGERDEEDYFFVTESIFQKMVDAHAFMEHAQVFDYHYGTAFDPVIAHLQRGTDVLLDIDWQGAALVKAAFPSAVSVFVLPPSLEELRRRLLARQRDAMMVIEKRMARAVEEMRHVHAFDYVIVNDTFSLACDALTAIITANRLTQVRQMQQESTLIANLLSSAC